MADGRWRRAIIYAMRMPGFTAASLVWRMIESAVPGLNDLHAEGPRKRSDRHIIGSLVMCWVQGFGCFGICTFNRPLVEIWVGADLYQAGGVTTGIAFFMLSAHSTRY